MRICLTGASGFIGQSLVAALKTYNRPFVSLNRASAAQDAEDGVFKFDFCSLDDVDSRVFQNFDVLIHCAAAKSNGLLDRFFRPEEADLLTHEATVKLAKAAASAGVKRFIFLSSIKAIGENTGPDERFNETTECQPATVYGKYKYKTEQTITSIANSNDMEIVIIRPPLVYGPPINGNIRKLVLLIKARIPLPFKGMMNSRSLIAVENLVDFILLCADAERSPRAANQIFVISDDEDISTENLVIKLAEAYGLRVVLFAFPFAIFTHMLGVVGIGSLHQKMSMNLQVDSTKAKELLHWKPVISLEAQLVKMADYSRRLGGKPNR